MNATDATYPTDWNFTVSPWWNHSDSNTTPTMSLEDYLKYVRGPKHLPLSVVVPITVIYLVIFVTGLIGNVAVCAVIARNPAMHTATNYYLFSLAVSDLMMLIFGLPNDLGVFWQQYPWVLGETVCKTRALVSEMMSYTSVLTIVAFSMERYLAICHPLYSYTMSGLKRAVRIIAVVWLVSLLCASPFAAFTKIDYITYPPGSQVFILDSAFCAMFNHNIPENFPICEISFIFFFLLPMVIILVLYIRIGYVIRSRQKNSIGETNAQGESRKAKSKKAIIRMLATVVIAFFLCWAPFHAQRLLYVYAHESLYYRELNEWVFYITGCFYYFSSTVNPILYNLMSTKYRVAFKETLFCWRRPRLASLRDATTDTTVLQRGRSVLQSTYSSTRRYNEELNDASSTLDMSIIVTANGKSRITRTPNSSHVDTVNEETCFIQNDRENTHIDSRV